MREGIEQRLMFVLAVQLHEPRRQIAQRRRGRQGAIDERAASSLAADFTADDQLALAALFENGLDGGLRLARADQISGGARAEKKANGLDEDGLAGARLPRQH